MTDGAASPVPHRKVPFTAAVLIPPEGLWGPIQRIRRAHDPRVDRWMPHVTLLYPFVPAAALAQAAAELSGPCAAALPFHVRLAEFAWFAHGSAWATMWLHPDPPGPLVRLQSRLWECFPWCDDAGRFANGFTPHLSVGRWSVREVSGAAAQLQRSWEPLDWPVDRVCLIARPPTGEGAFTVQHELALGRRS